MPVGFTSAMIENMASFGEPEDQDSANLTQTIPGIPFTD